MLLKSKHPTSLGCLATADRVVSPLLFLAQGPPWRGEASTHAFDTQTQSEPLGTLCTASERTKRLAGGRAQPRLQPEAADREEPVAG